MNLKQCLALPVLFFCFHSLNAQININTGATLTQIVNSIVGPGNTVSNVTLNCPSGSYATFTNGSSTNVGMSQGVLLTTGNATDVNGPGSNFASIDNTSGSDALLDALTPGTTYNKCRIEFDIIPSCSTLQMQYVFGSEEYPEFVGSTYNDIFGFFITGPNPAGPAYNNQNIAIIPSTTTAVSINNVNSGSYSQYYVDNQSGGSIVYDGLTTPLMASVNVVPCSTYHMILAIADVGDAYWDSGVFLSYQGLTCPSPIVTASNDVTICGGTSTTLTATFSAPTPSYTWSPAAGLNVTTGASVTASPVSTTTYIVTATSGCNVSTDTVIVTVTPQPTVTVTPPSSTICPSSSATLTASGATSYTWSPITGLTPTTGATVTAAPSTTTIYTVTGSNGTCTATATATVTVVNNLTVAITPASSSICAGGNVSLTASGATNYSWSPITGLTPATGATVTASPSTTTVYTVTGSSGSCTATATATVTITPQPTVTVTPASSTICPNSSVVLTASAAPSYTWSPATGLTPNTGATVTAAPSTTTIYTVTGSNGSCSATATATVTVSNALTINAGPDVSICQGSSTQLNVTGVPAGSTISWSPSTGLSNASSASPTSSATVTTTYIVNVTTSGGCTGSDTVIVTVNPAVTLATAGFPPTCAGTCDGQVVVIPSNGTQPYTMAWNTGCTTASCSGLCPGTYSVTITDAAGCQASGTATVNPTTPLTFTITATPSTCSQPDGTACVQVSGGSPGYSYLWNTNPPQTGSCANGLVPGVYCVTVTDVNGCNDSVCVTVPNTPGITASICASASPSCNGACDGTANVCVNGGTAPYIYSWSNGQTAATATGLCAGTYTVNVTSANGCTDTAVVTLVDPTIVTVTPSAPVTICIGQSTNLTAAGAGGTGSAYTYDWTSPAYTGSPYSVSPQATTVYTVIAYDANNCPSAPAQVTVTVNPPLSVTAAGSTTICPGGSTQLTANGSGGDGTYTYTWLPNGTGTGSPLTVTLNSTTTFTVVITDGCTTLSDSDTVTVFVSPLPTVSYTTTNPNGCAPLLCTTFNDLSTPGSGTIASWSWNFGDGSPAGSAQSPQHCYSAPGTYTVSLTVTNSFGCQQTYTTPDMITVYSLPVAQFEFGPQPTTVLDPQICFTDQSSGAAAWEWNFGDPADPTPGNTQNPCYAYPDTGTYCTELIVTNTYGCRDTTINCLVISPEFTFYIPNAFTPNDDGMNDEFSGVGLFIKKYEMYIFDRWGNLIYYTDDLNKKWNGHASQGKDIAQEDVYVYVVKLKDIFDKEHKYRGHVTLIK
jgi:gliding motility-associated-like protein